MSQAGRVSGYLHENLTPGREVLFRGVDGDFTLDKAVRCIPPAGERRSLVRPTLFRKHISKAKLSQSL